MTCRNLMRESKVCSETNAKGACSVRHQTIIRPWQRGAERAATRSAKSKSISSDCKASTPKRHECKRQTQQLMCKSNEKKKNLRRAERAMVIRASSEGDDDGTFDVTSSLEAETAPQPRSRSRHPHRGSSPRRDPC